METAEIIINGYLKLLNNLSNEHKLDLISKLILSIKNNDNINGNNFLSSFGSWYGDETADEIINNIYSSRTSRREIVQL